MKKFISILSICTLCSIGACREQADERVSVTVPGENRSSCMLRDSIPGNQADPGGDKEEEPRKDLQQWRAAP